MTRRIAIGGFQHESHSFAPRPTTYQDFLKPGGFPALVRGAPMIAALRGTSVPAAGAIVAAEAAGAAVVPLAWCLASPAGPVQDQAFERIAAQIAGTLTLALEEEAPPDGVYLDLHGAAVSDHFPDAEGELLRRVRAIVGPDLPIAVSLDPHANLTPAMVALADVVVPYRTYPHIDARETGARAIRLLLSRIERGAPWPRAIRQLDFWIPLGSQCTLVDPMRGIMEARAAQAAASGVVELAWCFGFPYADFPGCGAAIAAYAETQDAADAAAEGFAAHIAAREATFVADTLPVTQAVARALAAAPGAASGSVGGPVVIADTQDNPGGGGHGDTTGLLAELVRQNADGALLCLINDAESAAACHAAGEGAAVALSLGGKSDGAPFACTATVLRLTDGRFTLTGPMGAGNPADLGPSALIEVAPGIRVIVVSRKMQALDRAIIRHFGVDPASCRIIGVKSSVHFRADFGPVASEVIVALAPGPVVADAASLPFRNLRPGLRLRPRAA